MNKKILLSFLLGLAIVFSCKGPDRSNMKVVPRPNSFWVNVSEFKITPQTRILTQTENEKVLEVAQYLAEKINTSSGIPLGIGDLEKVESISKDIIISTLNADTAWGRDGYRLDVQAGRVIIHALQAPGLFYGVQSFLQLLPPEVESPEIVPELELSIPTMTIRDSPRFSWRGMHLDVGRHFFPREFIFRYLDLMAMYKMNVFHWHLVEDQGWRLEIKNYPKLTEIAAWRTEPDGNIYGGFYTQEDVKAIVAYAEKLHITIVPEIELPGHCMASLAAYPELSCTGGPFEVPSIWGVKKEVYCAGNEKTFEFLENVLLEVIELFPGEYIHIGGDEVPKDRWEKCRKCQQRIKDEGLADENELQSYFIKRIASFLEKHGKKVIGWDEILEGGLAPGAAVMSWRGVEGGIEAAQMGHDVVMTPTSHCYFDYYQADPSTEPLAIGGFTPLSKVYGYDPVPSELNEHEAKHILGTQGNLWTEYITTPEQAEYMAVPRMIALAEVAWSSPDHRDWKYFMERMVNQWPRLDIIGINYSPAVFRVMIKPGFNDTARAVVVGLETELADPEIRYTLDGTDPDIGSVLYEHPFQVNSTTTIKAAMFENGKLMRLPTEKTIHFHKAAGKNVSYKAPFSEKYDAGGVFGLVDGLTGGIYYNDGYWQGFHGDDMDVVIDLGQSQVISSVSVTFLQKMPTWIFMPEVVKFYVSQDGITFQDIAEIMNDIPQEKKDATIREFKQTFPEMTARYIKVQARNTGTCPDWHSGAGQPAWIFADEIVIN